MKIVIEGISKQQNARAVVVRERPLFEPFFEAPGCESRQIPLRSHTSNPFDDAAEEGLFRKEISRFGAYAGEPGPAVNEPECVGVAWTQPMFVIMGKEFGLVAGHV